MKTITDRQPGAGEIVMICAHSTVKSATLHGAHLIKIPGGPRVFSNLDDRFFSEWLYLCDDCHAKACAGIRDVGSLIHGPMEWTSEREGRADAAVTENSGAHDDRRRSGFPASSHG
jgi:hypothetical protein